MPASVVGRDAELAAIDDFLAGIPEGASALVLEGEAGMGKTTLWRAGIDEAERDGRLVLRAQPAESETALSFSALGDLLDPVLESALGELPEGQRAALSRALVLDDGSGAAPDPHAVGVAVLNVLRMLAEECALVVGADDVQWLDPASAAALAYAVRRLGREPVGVVLARRTGLESALVDEVRRAPIGERVTQLEVGAMPADGLHQVVQARLGVALPRPLLAEVHQASGGNPLYALEIVRTLTRGGVTVEAGRPLPVPDSLHDAVHGRLLALSDESRDFLAAAAAHAHPTVAVTEAASGVAADVGLPPALDAQILVLDRDRLRFTHPLLAAGAYEATDPRRLAEIHARLADLLTDPEARAWQLAASADGPDESVALALESAANHARARGAPRPAALLLDRARELTPADIGEDGTRRGIAAALLHFEAGDPRRAEEQLRDLVAPLPASAQRSRALSGLAHIRLYEAPSEARELFLQVIEEAGGDRLRLADAHEGVAACDLLMYERLDEALSNSDVALAIADDVGNDTLAACVMRTRIGAEALLGRDATLVVDRALALQGSAADLRILEQPLVALAEYWTWVDEQTRARRTLIELVERADERGDENARPFLFFLLGQAECALGELETALVWSRAARSSAEQSGQPLFRELGLSLECFVLASMGRVDEAAGAPDRLRGMGSDHLGRLIQLAGLGHLDLSRGRSSDAVAYLEPCVSLARRERIVEPGATRFVIDHVESLIELARSDEAVEILDWYEGHALRLERASALANCARCRGLVAAQAGDLDSALASFDEALAWHAKVELPLDRGRTLLALGAALRRLKRRREARTTLEEALGVFERIGAALWAERARGELKRISGRAATPGALTPAEERVAALVAQGKTNKQVAAALFVSERTVEGHLARIFGKLSIRNRTEIASVLARDQIQVVVPSNTGDGTVSAESSAP